MNKDKEAQVKDESKSKAQAKAQSEELGQVEIKAEVKSQRPDQIAENKEVEIIGSGQVNQEGQLEYPKKKPWQKVGIIAVGLLGGLILLVVLFVGFLQLNVFPVKPQTNQVMETYFLQADVFQDMGIDKDNFYLKIPLEVINQELTKQALEQESQAYNLEFDIAANKAWVNYKINGFYIPVLYQLSPTLNSQEIEYKLQAKALGKMGLPISTGLLQQFISQNNLLPNTIGIHSLEFNTYGLDLSDWSQETGHILSKFKLAGEPLDEIVEQVEELADNEVRYIYEVGSDQEKNLLRLIYEYPSSKKELSNLLVESYFKEDSLFKKFLLLMDMEIMEKTFTDFPFIEGKYERNQLLKERSDLVAESISTYGKDILRATREWMAASGGEFYNNGYPFLKKHLRTVTIPEVIETWNLSISKSIRPKIHFGLDRTDNQLAVIYMVDEGSYAVIKEDGYFVVDEKTYHARYHRSAPPSGDLTWNPETWQAITDKLKASFNTSQVFIRYMKDDGNDAFILLSFLEKPQDVQAVTFSKIDGQWQPTASNFKDISSLQGQDSRFNLNLYTDIYEDPQLIYIDQDALDNIVEELSYGQKLGQGAYPVYYSYKGKYIYVKLSDGAEYVLTTYHQYLDKIYSKEEAITIFGDQMPRIILLQAQAKGVENSLQDDQGLESGSENKEEPQG